MPTLHSLALGSPVAQIVFLGLLFDETGTLVNTVVAIGSSRVAERLRTPSRGSVVLQRMTGVVLSRWG